MLLWHIPHAFWCAHCRTRKKSYENFDVLLIALVRISTKRLGKLFVQSLVLSLINYCISVWGSAGKLLPHSVQYLLNFAGKIVTGGETKLWPRNSFYKKTEVVDLQTNIFFWGMHHSVQSWVVYNVSNSQKEYSKHNKARK